MDLSQKTADYLTALENSPEKTQNASKPADLELTEGPEGVTETQNSPEETQAIRENQVTQNTQEPQPTPDPSEKPKKDHKILRFFGGIVASAFGTVLRIVLVVVFLGALVLGLAEWGKADPNSFLGDKGTLGVVFGEHGAIYQATGVFGGIGAGISNFFAGLSCKTTTFSIAVGENPTVADAAEKTKATFVDKSGQEISALSGYNSCSGIQGLSGIFSEGLVVVWKLRPEMYSLPARDVELDVMQAYLIDKNGTVVFRQR